MTAFQMNFFGEEVKINRNENKVKTVISASRRTDIPAFFYEWLQDILLKGEVKISNPIFPQKTYIVDLRPQNVHSIALWSKDFKNVLKNPMQLENYNLYFQYTINNYSKFLEPNVPGYKETIGTLDGLLKRYKPEQFNIRFDPIIISNKGEINPISNAPGKTRLIAFGQLCKDLKMLGMEKCKITTSYVSLYGHVKNKLMKSGIDIIELNHEKQILFFEEMSEIANKYNEFLYSCSSPIIENVKGINRGSCIDGELLEKLFGGKVRKSKDKGQRIACQCSYSKDIGTYAVNKGGMRCQHGCLYCYANRSNDGVDRNISTHRPESPSLIGWHDRC